MITINNVNICRQHVFIRRMLMSFSKSVLPISSSGFKRCYCKDKKDSNSNNEPITTDTNISLSIKEKFEYFKDEDSPVILDILEERFKALQFETEPQDEYSGLNLERGKEGVFDIEDLVGLLRREKAQNIFVVKIPPDLKYIDYIVVVTGKSVRHIKALAEFTRKVFKRKRNTRDIIPRIEGEDSKDWIAMDLGNIALHIFSERARNVYDLESLWSLGVEFDEKSRQPEDPLVELLRKHSVYLGDLQPASTRQ